MTALDAAEEVLRKAGTPLHFKSITKLMLESGSWRSTAKEPSNTVSTRLSDDIAANGGKSKFRRVKPGVYGLNDHRAPAQPTNPSTLAPAAMEAKLSYTDAAEQVLRENDGREPLHYREITRRILDLGLVATNSKKASDVLHSSIHDEIRRREKSSKPQRFVRLGHGLIGLADADPDKPKESSVDTDLTSEAKLSYTDAAERIPARTTAESRFTTERSHDGCSTSSWSRQGQ